MGSEILELQGCWDLIHGTTDEAEAVGAVSWAVCSVEKTEIGTKNTFNLLGNDDMEDETKDEKRACEVMTMTEVMTMRDQGKNQAKKKDKKLRKEQGKV